MPLRLTAFARWIPALLWMGVIFYWSNQPSVVSVDWTISKFAHVVEYSLLAALLAFALSKSKRWALGAWIVASIYAITDELHQGLVPTRHPMATDVLIDSAAAALTIQAIRQLRSIGRRGASNRPTTVGRNA